MKPFATLTALLLSLLAGLAFAQSTPQVQSVRPNAPVTAPRIAPTPVQQEAPTVNTDITDPQGTIDRLRAQNKALRQENERLKKDVLARDERIAQFTTRGGSAVRAYCEDEATSRNTAGATQSCGPFACNDVSGLCYTSCTLTEHCSSGACFNGQCLTQAPSSDD